MTMSPRSVVMVTLYMASVLMLMAGGLAIVGYLQDRGWEPGEPRGFPMPAGQGPPAPTLNSVGPLAPRSSAALLAGLVEELLHLVVEGAVGHQGQVALEVGDGGPGVVLAPQLDHAPEEVGVGVVGGGGDGGVEPGQGPVGQLGRRLRVGA